MAAIALTYPVSWLSITVSLTNTTTNVVDFVWLATEVLNTKVYVYTFTEAADTDYVYVASAVWYSNLSGIIYRDTASSGWGGLTPTQAAQLASTVKTGDAIINLWDILIPL